MWAVEHLWAAGNPSAWCCSQTMQHCSGALQSCAGCSKPCPHRGTSTCASWLRLPPNSVKDHPSSIAHSWRARVAATAAGLTVCLISGCRRDDVLCGWNPRG